MSTVESRWESGNNQNPTNPLTHQDQIFMGAVALGCTPVWTGHMWECRCPRAVHAVSTTYTAITLQSLGRAKDEL